MTGDEQVPGMGFAEKMGNDCGGGFWHYLTPKTVKIPLY